MQHEFVRRTRSGVGAASFAALATVALAASLFGGRADAAPNALHTGEGSVFADPSSVPPFPEGLAVDHNHVYVAGPAAFTDNGGQPSEVRIFHRKTGYLVETIPIQGEDLSGFHGLVGLTVDAQHRVYVVSNQLGIVRLTRQGDHFEQDIYSPPLPEVACNPTLAPWMPCSLPNDITFGPDGYLYWSDSFQNTIFRVPPGGGEAEPWFSSDLLAGSPFSPVPVGPNGLAVSPDGGSLYIAVTSSAAGPGGAIVRLPLVDDPDESEMEIVHQYGAGEAPDGMAFGESGKLYVALQFPNQVSILGPDGAEHARLHGPRGSSIAYDAPANIAFDNKGSLLVTNHALYSGDAASFAVLGVFVGDKAAEGNAAAP